MKEHVAISNQNNFENILYDPQTNGAMLMVINPNHRSNFEKQFFQKYGYEPLYLGKFTELQNQMINCV